MVRILNLPSRPLQALFELLLTLNAVLYPISAAAWDEVWIGEEKEPVRVWTQKVPGSDFDAFKGEVVINASIDQILSVIRDTQNVPKWYYRTLEARQLKRLNKHQALNYAVTSAPWPVSDRDSVTLATVHKSEDGIVTIELEARPDAYPKQPNRIRIPRLDGFWQLRPISEGQTQVILQIATEPGGQIPSWLANVMVVEMPYYSLTRLKTRVESIYPSP
ncbi:START domain-containing protein [Thiomicrorhabdus sp. zzn3]|uniref:START domain-containing protein n=1 Tax=Thiomicrorhabdus sp. zzn3 TaxID=3039775 RepID=UPI002436A205|nr:START domain-containing protein [Thiomicrorhabdus sp. zzn3]MDG6777965.1 START domain-containing protein [Thiomicrorhabdus sp. zzn3]